MEFAVVALVTAGIFGIVNKVLANKSNYVKTKGFYLIGSRTFHCIGIGDHVCFYPFL